MTATLSRDQEAARSVYTVERTRDGDEIRALLAPHRAYAAYALAQLEPARFGLSQWFKATGPEGSALVLHSRGGLGRALFSLGDAEAVDAILSLHPGPHFSFGSIQPEHRSVAQTHYIMARQQVMMRMSVSPDSFSPREGEALRLRATDTSDINLLYSAEGGATAYRASDVEDGVYYGVRLDGRLVSIAGTHVVSRQEGAAVVGNVFTHPRYRGRGLGTIATSATTADLLQDCPLVVLTVEETNAPAVAGYKRLGYATQCTLHETPLVRKDPLGGFSLARRIIAGWRGRREGKEVVAR